MYEVSVIESFSSAHFLPDYNGKCEQLHGHNYKVVLVVRGDTLQKPGILIDFTLLKDALKKVLDRLDHRLLNELSWFENQAPSAENIARVIHDETTALIPGNRIFAVEVWETERNRAVFYPGA